MDKNCADTRDTLPYPRANFTERLYGSKLRRMTLLDVVPLDFGLKGPGKSLKNSIYKVQHGESKRVCSSLTLTLTLTLTSFSILPPSWF